MKTPIPAVFLALGIAAGLATSPVHADIRLPKIFNSHMALPQGKPIFIWGGAAPGEKTTAQLGEATQSTVANDQGEWKVSPPAMKAGGPHTPKVAGAIYSSQAAYPHILTGG